MRIGGGGVMKTCETNFCVNIKSNFGSTWPPHAILELSACSWKDVFRVVDVRAVVIVYD